MNRLDPWLIVALMAWLVVMPATSLFAQTVQAKVSLSADRLVPEDRQLLAELPRALQDYINGYRWGNDDREMIIHCEFNFIIERVDTRNAEKVFSGQLLVSSQSGENFLDKFVQFPFQQGFLMTHDRGQFESLLSITDFYMYMVLGGELDTYILRGGTRYYDAARKMVSEGLISNYARGWTFRQELVETITDGDHQGLREAKFYFYDGLFYIEVKNNPSVARDRAQKVVEALDRVHRRKPNSTALKRFLDAHYPEFCTLFKFDENRKNILAMANIDNRHRETYVECQTGGAALRDF